MVPTETLARSHEPAPDTSSVMTQVWPAPSETLTVPPGMAVLGLLAATVTLTVYGAPRYDGVELSEAALVIVTVVGALLTTCGDPTRPPAELLTLVSPS